MRQTWNRFACGTALVALALALEPMRCSLPTTAVEAAQFPPAIVIGSGKSAQGYPYLFGGVSSDEREAMAQRAKEFNLKLVFAAKSGPFVSGVAVTIADPKGAQIVKLETEGPWFYIQLPPGAYSIEASFKGRSKQLKGFRVARDKTVQQTFVWDVEGAAKP